MTVNDAEYYESDSANANESKGDPASDPKIATHTSYVKKKKVTEISNRYLQQNILSNRTLPIIATSIYPWIDNRVATFGASPHKIATSQIMEVVSDAARSIVQVLQTRRRVIRMGRDGTNPGD